jgi:LysR family hydrogen peroxide-inducible transcriptional activator
MTLQELRFIVALAREQHFRKAAEKCHVSQPSLSIAIAKLEKKLGIALFERYKNEVRVTSIGNQIVNRAKKILEEVDQINQIAQSEKDPLNGVFKLGVIYTVGPYLLPQLIPALNKAAPRMPIEIYENFTGNLRQKLTSAELDAIIISLPFTEPGVVTHQLYQEPFVVLMPGDHALTTKKAISEDDLMKHSMLMLGEGHCFRDQVISSCPSCFSAPQTLKWQTVEGSSLETIRHMVASKMGLTILPASAANHHAYKENLLTTRPLQAASPQRTIALAWRNSFVRAKALDVIINSLKKCEFIT